MNKTIKEHIIITAILILFALSFYYLLNPNADLWWDSSVYIGIGKYIYSSGNSGLYEASRPLVWPLILGFFWKIGMDAIFFGKLVVLLSGAGIITVAYLIAYELFGKKIALISALLLAFSPTFFLFNSIIFSEIPSTFFAVLGIYFFVKKRYNLSGLFFGITFMARFFQILLAIPFYLFFIYLMHKKKATLKQFFASILFFLIPVTPYLIVNLFLFKNPFYPFFLQSYMTQFTGWVYSQPFWFYFLNITKENALALFSIIGILFIFKNEKGIKQIVPFAFLMAFIPYNFAAHKEMRFLISVFPLLYISTAYGIVKFSELFKKHGNIIILLILLIGAFQVAPKLRLNDYDDKLDTFYSFMESNDIKSGLWISNPSFIAYNNAEADELIYYPLYNINQINELDKKSDEAKYVLINTCDILPCPPNESQCNKEHSNFINLLKNKMNTYFYEKIGECEHYIFTSRS